MNSPGPPGRSGTGLIPTLAKRHRVIGVEFAGITAPTLIVQGDRDFTTVEHAGLMLRLIPASQLLVLPGTTHMQATRRSELLLPALEALLG